MGVFRKKSITDVWGSAEGHPQELSRQLGVWDLTSFGIAAIIGAGIFSTIGKASYDAGPGVIFLFIFTAIACGFAALSYAEFASYVPVSGSAYTYAYVAFGEIFAWIIGWSLTLEYAVGNCTVAISWSDYFCSLLSNVSGYSLYEWLTMDYFTAREHYHVILGLLWSGIPMEEIRTIPEVSGKIDGFQAWSTAPEVAGLKIILDAPALGMNLLITWLVYRGIKETKRAANAMVLVKISVVLLVIVVGAFYVNVKNWSPFMPNGISGVLSGISAVFFAYIGFDAISTTAEECRNPQRDLPRGVIYSVLLCTLLYALVALVLTGMVSYKELNVADPLAYVFEKIKNLRWLAGIIAVSAVVAMASVMLVFQMGQPRIWMAMSRDGLLPVAFSRVHKRYQTPSFATVVTGVMVAFCVLTMDINMVTDICSAGTLFAFTVVCAGVMHLRSRPEYKPSFSMPYINGKYIFPFLLILFLLIMYLAEPGLLEYYFKWESARAFFVKTPFYLFLLVFGLLCVFGWKKNYSLLPGLGMLCCSYMFSQLGYKNWLYFVGWLLVGLMVYFVYGYKKSRWKKELSSSPEPHQA